MELVLMVLLPFPLGFRVRQFLGYAAVNLIIYAVGLGLVVLGHRVASTRRDTPAPSVGQH